MIIFVAKFPDPSRNTMVFGISLEVAAFAAMVAAATFAARLTANGTDHRSALSSR